MVDLSRKKIIKRVCLYVNVVNYYVCLFISVAVISLLQRQVATFCWMEMNLNENYNEIVINQINGVKTR